NRQQARYNEHQLAIRGDMTQQREATTPEELAAARERRAVDVTTARAEEERAALVRGANERMDVLSRQLGIRPNEHRGVDPRRVRHTNRIWQNVASMIAMPFDFMPTYHGHASAYARHV